MSAVHLTRPLLAEVLDAARDHPLLQLGRRHALDICMEASPAWRGGWLADGRPVIAAGLWPIWPGRAQAWMVVAEGTRCRDIVATVRECAIGMDRLQRRESALRRIEMWVSADAPWHASFARALGMQWEGHAHCWGPAGDDHVLYARIAR
jgi:hypothetical protein